MAILGVLRASIRPSLLACELQARLLPKGLPEVMKRWQSNSSDSSTMQLVGPAPSQLPMPGERGHEHFFKNLERFHKGQYPVMSVKEFEELAHTTALQKLLTEMLEKQEAIHAEVREIHAEVIKIHTKVQSIEAFLTKKPKLDNGSDK
ncbi:MAG: hypothetical protein HYZ54_09335 [Ignavibacteriae bacterium]|nr:hypothetical protein [Ignavibacteriota bacterium]